jgi:hypothetical protein
LTSLQKVGLFELDKSGKLHKTNQNIQTQSEIPSRIEKKIHHKFLSQASVALETQLIEKNHSDNLKRAINWLDLCCNSTYEALYTWMLL